MRTLRPLCLLLLLPFCLLASERVFAANSRPNILFIMSDDHGYQAISAYGSRVNKTPNLDRIAKDGVRFDRCFVTNSICGPSRAVILTGKYSHLNGFVRNGNTFNGQQQHVGKILQKAGYQTAVIGKWHLRSEPTGFDYYHVLKGQGPYYNPVMRTSNGDVEHTGYTTEIITDVALKWLQEQRDADKPFFLIYQHKAPHRNWQPGPKQLNNYDDVTIPEPETLFDDYEGRGSAAKMQKMTVAEHLTPNDLKLTPPRGLNEEQLAAWNAAYEKKNAAFKAANLEGVDRIRWNYQRYAKDYLRCVDAVDENVGRVLDYLDDTGLSQNTVVFYTSDQGWYLGEHGWYDKRWMYEESFRTPLLIRWPGKTKPGSVSRDLVMNLDFAQTFLDIAGVEAPADMQGSSLKSILEGNAPDNWRKSVYYRYYEYPGAHSVRQHYGVRTDRFKLIYFNNLDEWEFYDLEKDPYELRSAYEDPQYATKVEELKAELKRLQEFYKDDGSVVDFGIQRARQVRRQQVFTLEPDKLKKSDHFKIVDGRSGAAVATTGKAIVSLKSQGPLDPSYKPMVLGGWCKPAQGDGVVIAQGGESHGYALFLEKGAPVFALRQAGQLKAVRGDGFLANGEWTHLAVVLDSEGQAELLVNGKSVAKAKLGLVVSQPSDDLSIGADMGSLVGEYPEGNGFEGVLEDIRIYWGSPTRRVLTQWMKP